MPRISRLVYQVGYRASPAATLRNLLLRATPPRVAGQQFYHVHLLGY